MLINGADILLKFGEFLLEGSDFFCFCIDDPCTFFKVSLEIRKFILEAVEFLYSAG